MGGFAAFRRKLIRLRALFNPDDVPATVVEDLAVDANRAWSHGYAEVAVTGFWAIARRLPRLLRLTLRMAADTSRPRTVWMLTLQAVSGICQAVSLFATTNVLGALFASRPTPDRVTAALPSLVVIGCFTALQSGASSVGSLLVAQLSPRMDAVALLRLQQLVTEVELAAFDSAGWMDAETRAERGAVSPRYLLQATVRVMRGAVAIAAATAVLALIHPLLVPLLLLTIAPKVWAEIRSARLDFAVFVRQAEGRRRQNQISNLGQNIGYAPEVRALGLAAYLTGRYKRLADLLAAENSALHRAEALSNMLGDTLSGIAMAGAYAVLLMLLFGGWIPLAAGGTAFFAIGRTQSALMTLVTFTNDLYAEGLYFDAFEEFRARAEKHLPSPATAPAPRGFAEIRVEDVSFTYTGATRPAVSRASLTIKAGQVVALVGENGAAKTTMAKLLGRQYLPDSGRILWDGADTAAMDPEMLRSQIAYIAQDGMRAAFSALENIRIGAWRTAVGLDGEAAVVSAAQASGAHDFISALPLGYATLMDRSLTAGTNVSGGQWQRVALARGLLKDAALVLADEPTAHLDAAAEIEFYQRLRSYGGTVVLVTHRMNAVRSCADYIFVIEDGTVTAHGTHGELLDHGDNWYAAAFRLQQNSFTADRETGDVHG